MDWTKHGFGPGTDTCCRCKGDKEASRHQSKWCRQCEADMRGGRQRVTGALDTPDRSPAKRQTRIVNKGRAR